MREKNIKFYPVIELLEDAMPYPQPASEFIPEWYRKTSTHIDRSQGAKVISNGEIDGNLTVKRCMPFFDAMTSGYMATLPADVIFLKPQPNQHRVVWSVTYDVLGTHGKQQVELMPHPEGYSDVFKWYFYFKIQTPPGYSCMFSHPNFMYDLPFHTISGVVDTDTHPIAVSFPFFLKDGFEGTIKRGTPICQITPFKRESWKMKKEKFDTNSASHITNFYSVIEKSYKNRFWSRKSYK